MKHITIELSSESIQNAIEKLQEYQKNIKPKLDEVCRRLAQTGAETARAHLSLANGNDSATISEPIPIENGYKFSMSGEDVYFIEFGTGDDVNAYTPNVSVLVAPGSWSETHSKKYMNYGFWYYNKVRYEGTPAYMPMYYAGKAIREALPKVIKEVLG